MRRVTIPLEDETMNKLIEYKEANGKTPFAVIIRIALRDFFNAKAQVKSSKNNRKTLAGAK